MNNLILSGHLGKDAETKPLENGSSVTKFTVATTESYKNKAGEKVSNTTWHDCEAWNLKGVTPYLKKGQAVIIKGSSTFDLWQDKEGNNRKSHKVKAQSIELIGGAKAGNNTTPADVKTGGESKDFVETEGSDDLPF